MDSTTKIVTFIQEVSEMEHPSMSLRHVVEHALNKLCETEDPRKANDAKRITDLALVVERELANATHEARSKTKGEL